MVHKKSEYRLQYHLIPEDIRKKIWTDNVTLRDSRKLSNQADHYWEYQLTDDNCVCDGEDEVDSGPPPPHKLKHKTLLARYEQRSRSCSNGLDQPSRSEMDRYREMAVQTPNWKTKLDKLKKDNESETDSGRASCDEMQDVMKNMSTLTLPEVSTSEGGRSSVNGRPRTPAPPATASSPHPSSQRPSSALRQRSRTPGPARLCKKLMVEGRKTHFVPYGWNDRQTDIGQKKTFNVLAPEKEVHHHPAVESSRRKKAELEKFIREDMAKQKYRLKTPYPLGNASSIWTSEYKEQFCRSRPASAPPPPS
ncbi:centriole, cilia and spindle-associated protein isoform X1 [Nilaparvata lugens]|uniref:centriole, cilia and spindle-associated protein isoform X1 n=1 Tax=Nilaparvata lugens TaxID=108931 RepID=UPI00193E3D01|nr:centriole, cilia and spindle-associated protein isoform X1 [Nilaparvata lugens]